MRIINFDGYDYQAKENLFTSRKWIEVLRKEYQFDIKIIVNAENGSPLLLFSEINDIWGHRIVSLPFSDYIEPRVSDMDELLSVLEFLMETYRNYPITIRLHGHMSNAERIGYKNIRTAFCHRVPLNSDMDDIWKKTNYAFRKGVNKAKTANLKVERVNSEYGIDIFYHLLLKLRKNKLNLLPQTKSFYRQMLDLFIIKGEGNIWVVFSGEAPIAAAVVLHSGNSLFDKMGASDEKYLDLRPNNLLLWEIMKYGNSIKYDYLDMGLTQNDHIGLLRFKDSLGGIRTPINFYRYTPENYDISREKDIKDLLSQLTNIFVSNEMPEEVVQQASGLLYKYFC
jgi:hypothetical protein